MRHLSPNLLELFSCSLQLQQGRRDFGCARCCRSLQDAHWALIMDVFTMISHCVASRCRMIGFTHFSLCFSKITITGWSLCDSGATWSGNAPSYTPTASQESSNETNETKTRLKGRMCLGSDFRWYLSATESKLLPFF